MVAMTGNWGYVTRPVTSAGVREVRQVIYHRHEQWPPWASVLVSSQHHRDKSESTLTTIIAPVSVHGQAQRESERERERGRGKGRKREREGEREKEREREREREREGEGGGPKISL